MADKYLISGVGLALNDQTFYREISPGVYALVRGAHITGSDVPLSVHIIDNDVPLTVDEVEVHKRPQDFETAQTHAPAVNTQAQITFPAAGTGVHNVISGVSWSYDGLPTNGNLTIEDGTDVVREWDITTGGPGFIPFNPPFQGTGDTALTVTLAAGGAGVSGKLNVDHWTA